jgi:hypothetical protein
VKGEQGSYWVGFGVQGFACLCLEPASERVEDYEVRPIRGFGGVALWSIGFVQDPSFDLGVSLDRLPVEPRKNKSSLLFHRLVWHSANEWYSLVGA